MKDLAEMQRSLMAANERTAKIAKKLADLRSSIEVRHLDRARSKGSLGVVFHSTASMAVGSGGQNRHRFGNGERTRRREPRTIMEPFPSMRPSLLNFCSK